MDEADIPEYLDINSSYFGFKDQYVKDQTFFNENINNINVIKSGLIKTINEKFDRILNINS